MSYKFFTNKTCEFFPCHKGIAERDFNCLFCYCPLYNIDDCGGNYTIINFQGKKIKDCSNCLLPHLEKNYDYIMKKLIEKNKEEKKMICKKCGKEFDSSVDFVEDVEMLEAINHFIDIKNYCPACIYDLESKLSDLAYLWKEEDTERVDIDISDHMYRELNEKARNNNMLLDTFITKIIEEQMAVEESKKEKKD